MRRTRSIVSAMLVLAAVSGVHGNLHAQVVEERQSESNPAVSIFRATLYGAGTGLLLGGAYALIESDSRDETFDALKWGAAGGAIAGAAVGLVYVLLRQQPQGDAEVVGMIDASDEGIRFGAPTLLLARRVDPGFRSFARPPSRGGIEARLLQARF